MRIPQSFIDEVKYRNKIEDVIASYVNLKRAGSNYQGLCPFHSEKTPSFTVFPNTETFHCFGCGAGGDVISFIMRAENLGYPGAVEFLAKRAGLEMPEEAGGAGSETVKRSRMYEMNRTAAVFFNKMLYAPESEPAREYLKQRGLSSAAVKRFGLGFAPNSFDALRRHMHSLGYGDDELKEAFLCGKSERTGGYFDYFRGRLIFPIIDNFSNVIAFGGRALGDGKPKYLNTSDTPVFKKSRNLFALNFAKNACAESLILCEGYMDVIAMHQAGFTQAVASLGTAFTSGQANLLRRYTENVILSYDSDGAGVKAALRAIGILKEAGLTGKVLNLEPYKDPDEFMKNLGREEFAKRLLQAENTFFFELRMMQKQYDLSDPEAKTKFYNEIAKKLCGFSEEVERENYTEAVAEKYNISMESLKKLVTGYAAKMGMAAEVIRPKQPVQQKNTPKEQQENVQKLLLTWLVEEPHLYKKIKKYITPLSFTNELYRQVAQELFPKLEEGKPNPAAIISRFSQEEEQREAASLFNTKLPYMQQDMESQSQVQEREKAFHDIVVKVKRNAYEHDLKASGSDMEALSRVISGRQELDELEKTHISFD